MTDRERWNALCGMIGKAHAYGIAHAGEMDALPLWPEIENPHERMHAFAWRVAIDRWCMESTKREA